MPRTGAPLPDLSAGFDFVIEAGQIAVNRILAAQHQVVSPRPIHPHSLSLRIDDRPRAGDGLARASERTSIVGLAQIQLAAPTIQIPETEGQVTVCFQLRAHLLSDLGSPRAPDLHGELRVTVAISRIVAASTTIIDLGITGEDVNVEFAPAADLPLTAEEETLITRVIGNVLHDMPTATGISIPMVGALRLYDLHATTVQEAGGQAIALLANVEPRPGAPSGSPTLIADDHEVAVGISADYLRRQLAGVTPAAGGPFGLSFDQTQLELQTGVVTVSISGNGTIPPVGLGFSFTASQRLAAATTPTTLGFTPLGEPTITINPPAIGAVARLYPGLLDQLRALRDQATSQANIALARLSPAAVTGMLGDYAAALTFGFVGCDIRPNGIVVRLGFDYPLQPPMASFTMAATNPHELTVDALESWIPAGSVDSFHWIDRSGGNLTRRLTERFITTLPNANGPLGPCSWCVEISGRQTTAFGEIEVASPVCNVATPILQRLAAADLPLLPLALIGGGDPEHGRLLAHLDPWARPNELSSRATLLVHFPEGVEELPSLLASLPAAQGRPSVLAIAVIASEDIDKLSPALLGKSALPLAIADDVEDRWTKGFNAGTRPFTIIVDTNGNIVSSHEGPLSKAKVVQLLANDTTPGGFLHYQQLTVAASLGQPAPEFAIPTDDGKQISLRHLHGQAVSLTFTAPWKQQPSTHPDGLLSGRLNLIIGTAPEHSEKAEDTIIVPDPKLEIGRRYKIRCWPTTIELDAAGIITRITSGPELAAKRSPADG